MSLDEEPDTESPEAKAERFQRLAVEAAQAAEAPAEPKVRATLLAIAAGYANVAARARAALKLRGLIV